MNTNTETQRVNMYFGTNKFLDIRCILYLYIICTYVCVLQQKITGVLTGSHLVFGDGAMRFTFRLQTEYMNLYFYTSKIN